MMRSNGDFNVLFEINYEILRKRDNFSLKKKKEIIKKLSKTEEEEFLICFF